MGNSLVENYRGVFDSQLGFGRSPVVLVVDFIKSYTEPSAKLYAEMVVEAVNQTQKLLKVAREVKVPVIHTKVLYNESFLDGGLFVKKVPVLKELIPGAPLAEIDDRVKPLKSETVVVKQYASAFFGTSLQAMLTSIGADTVILVGCSTSGCIRASAVDGMQYGFRVMVPRECVGDRDERPHVSNLFDINSKYGDVVSLGETLDYLENFR